MVRKDRGVGGCGFCDVDEYKRFHVMFSDWTEEQREDLVVMYNDEKT